MLIFRTDQFPLPLPDGHRFPAAKYQMLADAVHAIAAAHMTTAPAATPGELMLAHAVNYVAALFDGSVAPDIMREIGLPWSPQLVQRSARSVGATIGAAHSALQYGAGINLAGGTHHAGHAKGGGFCVFNDVAVAIRLLQQEGRIRRAAVIDLDVHQGNGTAELFAGDDSVFTLSLHGEKNFPFRRVPSTLDVGVADNTGDGAYLQLLDDALRTLTSNAQPDIVFYLAGADPYEGDRLGRLSLSKAGLLARDCRVFDLCEQQQWPLAVTMAGGYAVPIGDTVDIHLQTVRELLSRHHPKGG
ncbi:histone deacetylase [Vogesella sp. LIG4]|uniref:histone deacetylase family protein n=1 Tax=Vogesella sp. LIG4 TaxID=1192162 RepID=UPI00081F7676|nr:histone deacetylase [Vogesella sp. LIG4]SCK25881.1 Acetoin utilization deacetylase AcuC [Vogesella sp. LIG4]